MLILFLSELIYRKELMCLIIVLTFIHAQSFGCKENSLSTNYTSQYDYSIEQSRNCFCPQSGEPVKLFIFADTISDAIWIRTNEHLIPAERQRYRSIKGLLDEISLYDSTIFQITVEYDSIYQYPSRVSISPRPVIINDTIVIMIEDAGVAYRTWNYTKYK